MKTVKKLALASLLASVALSGCATLDKVSDKVSHKTSEPTKQDKSTMQKTEKPYRSTTQIMDESPKSDWYELNQDNLLYMTLANDKQVIIELNPTFAPEHAKQIKLLTTEGYWDGLSVYRVQDNYVAQFGSFDIVKDKSTRDLPKSAKKLPAEFYIDESKIKLAELKDKDPYADKIGFVDGFPVAVKDKEAFLVHCYGTVGAGRTNAPDSSEGNELYAMIGQPARNLDRQITVVGRVVQGIEHLSSLPRGSGVMGFYNDKDGTPMGIKSMKIGSQLKADEQVRLESIRTDSKTFFELIDARRDIQSPWHIAGKSSGGMALCDVRQTIRPLQILK